ncbi:MAG: hypothetical protein IJ193_07125 [Bacilli bacterium]|nr:hypothetical protein [Bacilli bacterium]
MKKKYLFIVLIVLLILFLCIIGINIVQIHSSCVCSKTETNEVDYKSVANDIIYKLYPEELYDCKIVSSSEYLFLYEISSKTSKEVVGSFLVNANEQSMYIANQLVKNSSKKNSGE